MEGPRGRDTGTRTSFGLRLSAGGGAQAEQAVLKDKMRNVDRGPWEVLSACKDRGEL